jgi:xylulokinase
MQAAGRLDDEQLLLIGCDIGTSAVKSILTSAGGELLGRSVTEHTMHRPRPGWAENDPEDWYRGVAATVRALIADARVDAGRVAAVGIVAQREPVVLIDRTGRSLTPSISWTDRRTAVEAREVSDRFGRTWLIQTTGMAPVPGSTLTHLLWLQRHRQPEWEQTRRIMFAKDYILHRLTGELGTDVSTPARGLMLDLARNDWSTEICDVFGIPLERLPTIDRAPWEPMGELQSGPAQELGLRAGTTVAVGGADDAAATLGGGAIDPGQLCVGTGTATNWRSVLDTAARPDLSGRGDVAPHVVPQRYIYEVAIESTGSSLRWLRETFALGIPFAELIDAAGRVAPGADGLLFYPYLDGAGRAPHYRPDATGSFLGIVSGHTRDHLVRALLEGVAYQYPATAKIVSSRSRIRAPIVTGDGEARSDVWNQLKADVLGMSLRVPRIVELAAAGAAILAGVAAGIFADAEEGVRALVRPAKTFDPDPARHAAYRDLRAEHERVFRHFAPESQSKES